MISNQPTNRKGYHHISFGSGVRLANEMWYVDEGFQGKLTRTQFRTLCKSLKVPMFCICDERYVDMHRFEVAMTAVLRIGEPNFVATTPSSRHPPLGGVRRLDLAKFRKNFGTIIAELIAAKKTATTKTPKAVLNATRLAAERLALAGLMHLPQGLQDSRAQHLARKLNLNCLYDDGPTASSETD